jgi:hypothetical protein
MILETIAASLSTASIIGIFKASKKKLTAREYKRLLRDAVAELLLLDPDIDKAEANIRAAQALGLPASEQSIHAEVMLQKVKSHDTRGAKKKSAKKMAGRKSAKKKSITYKKATRKKPVYRFVEEK